MDDVLKDDAFMILSDQEVAEHDIVRFGAYVFSDTLPQSSFEKNIVKIKMNISNLLFVDLQCWACGGLSIKGSCF